MHIDELRPQNLTMPPISQMRNMSISKLFEASVKKRDVPAQRPIHNDTRPGDGAALPEGIFPALDEEMRNEQDGEEMDIEERGEVVNREETPMDTEPLQETKVDKGKVKCRASHFVCGAIEYAVNKHRSGTNLHMESCHSFLSFFKCLPAINSD